MSRIALFTGWIWCSPLTALGLLAAAIGRVRFIGLRDGVLEFVAEPGGLIALVFRSTNTCGASGMWGVVAFYRGYPSEQTRLHEHRHAWQARVLGPLWPLVYGVASVASRLCGTGWYWGNALEVDARRAAGQCV